MAEDKAEAETTRVADPPAEDVKEEEEWKVQAEAFKTEGELVSTFATQLASAGSTLGGWCAHLPCRLDPCSTSCACVISRE